MHTGSITVEYILPKRKNWLEYHEFSNENAKLWFN